MRPDPMANGEQGLVGGIMLEIVEKMYERGFLGPQVTPEFWHKHYHRRTPFQAEGLKLMLDELVTDAGVEGVEHKKVNQTAIGCSSNHRGRVAAAATGHLTVCGLVAVAATGFLTAARAFLRTIGAALRLSGNRLTPNWPCPT